MSLCFCICSPVGTIPEQLGHCCCGHPQSHEARSRSSSGGEFTCEKLTLKNTALLFPLQSGTINSLKSGSHSRFLQVGHSVSALFRSLWIKLLVIAENSTSDQEQCMFLGAFMQNLLKSITLQTCGLNDRV